MAYRDQSADAPYPASYDSQYYPRDRSPDYATRPISRPSADASERQPRDKSPWDRRSFDNASQPIQQPLRSAIGHAFEKSDAASVVDPQLIAQIAAEVKKSVLDEIKSSGITGTTHPQHVPVSSQQWIPPSPTSTNNSVPPRDVYTPPSPKRTDFPSQPSPDRDPLYRDPLLDGNSDTPTPRFERSVPQERERPSARPNPPSRMATEEYTPIEKMWQRLFETDGRPLPRLGQLLRGLALHLIEDYEPKYSLVISPAKMLKFYEEVKIEDEIYPWKRIFGEIDYSSLSKIYRDLRCQHHFIQEHPAEQPRIPALTPEGFQEWMTILIQAYPDAEYDRLVKAILDMPISNADDRKERFPKELPRRMFPTIENLQAQQRFAAVLSSERVGPLRKAPSFPPPPPKPQAPPPGPNLERERSPYTSKPEMRSFDTEDEPLSTSVPIERERKPYSAAPGGGKSYDDMSSGTHSDTAANEKRRRAQSNAGQAPWVQSPGDPYYPQSHHPRTGSTNARPRSPSFSNYGTQSDPNVRDVPGSYYGSSMHNVEDDTRRYNKDSDSKRHSRRRSGVGLDGPLDSQSRSMYGDDDYRGRNGSGGYENRSYDSRRY